MLYKDRKGFTLLELMIVIAIVGILATLAQPMFKTAVLKSKEAALKEDLFNMRNVMDQYYADNGKYPDSLNDLVDKGYMRAIPSDPFTGSNTSWRLDPYSGSGTEGENPESAGGYWDVHSGSDQTGLNGKKYSEW
jgi:general secretion pathway protein G